MTYIYNPLTNELDYVGTGGGGGGGGGSGITWQAVPGTSLSAQPNYGYLCQNAALTQITLPAAAVTGTIIEVVAQGAGGFTILQNAGQSICFSTATTTVGIAGSIASTVTNDALRLLCITDNLKWMVISSVGNFLIN